MDSTTPGRAPARTASPDVRRLARLLAPSRAPGRLLIAASIAAWVLVAAGLSEWSLPLLLAAMLLARTISRRGAAPQLLRAAALIDAFGSSGAQALATRAVRRAQATSTDPLAAVLSAARQARFGSARDCSYGHVPGCAHHSPELPTDAPGWWPGDVTAALYDVPDPAAARGHLPRRGAPPVG